MGPENKDSRSWDGQIGCWTWLPDMTLLNECTATQSPSSKPTSMAWILHLGHGWSVLSTFRSEEKGHTATHTHPHTLSLSTRVGKSIHWWLFSVVGNFLQTAVLSSFVRVVHLSRFYLLSMSLSLGVYLNRVFQIFFRLYEFFHWSLEGTWKWHCDNT